MIMITTAVNVSKTERSGNLRESAMTLRMNVDNLSESGSCIAISHVRQRPLPLSLLPSSMRDAHRATHPVNENAHRLNVRRAARICGCLEDWGVCGGRRLDSVEFGIVGERSPLFQ